MKTSNIALAPTLALLFWSMTPAHASETGAELVNYMHKLQHYAHKTGLAIDAGNSRLAKFYAHELEEFIEEVEQVAEYDGYPIGTLTQSIFLPALEGLETAIAGGDPATLSAAFDTLVEKCNACHEAAGHAYVRIRRTTHNPFMQSFEPLP